MNKLTKLGLVAIVALTMLLTSGQAFSQELDGIGIKINTEQATIVVLIGIGGGFLTAYQGWRTSPESDTWSTLKFFDGVIQHTIAGVALAIGAAISQTEFGIFGYVTVFLAAIGAGVQINYSRRKTIP
jgi:hypothetical protein